MKIEPVSYVLMEFPDGAKMHFHLPLEDQAFLRERIWHDSDTNEIVVYHELIWTTRERLDDEPNAIPPGEDAETVRSSKPGG